MLYIRAIRYPASGYVQGLNDLVTPFLAVFIREACGASRASGDDDDADAGDKDASGEDDAAEKSGKEASTAPECPGGCEFGGESLTHSNPTQHAPVRVVTASGGHYSRRVVQSLGYELSARLAYTLTHITL